MPLDESTPPQRRALSPEEVGARVSAILEAAERDARAVIDAAHRAAAASREELTLERVAGQLDALSARVAALEAASGASASAALAASAPAASGEGAPAASVPAESAASAPAASPPRAEREPEQPSAAVQNLADSVGALRVRAIELALAGYPRAAIARELGAAMAPGEVDSLLDEVLAP